METFGQRLTHLFFELAKRIGFLSCLFVAAFVLYLLNPEFRVPLSDLIYHLLVGVVFVVVAACCYWALHRFAKTVKWLVYGEPSPDEEEGVE